MRRALAFVLLASALKLLGVPNGATGVILLLVLLVGPPLWVAARRRHGFPAFSGRLAAQAAGASPTAPGTPVAERGDAAT